MDPPAPELAASVAAVTARRRTATDERPARRVFDELRRVCHVDFEACSSTASSAGVLRGEKHLAIPGAGRADRFQPRLDFWVVRPPAQIASRAPGQSVELCYEVRAPEKINLALELNRTSYAHWSATFRNQAQPGVAHAWVRIALR